MEPGRQKLPKPELEFTTVNESLKERISEEAEQDALLACLEDGGYPSHCIPLVAWRRHADILSI